MLKNQPSALKKILHEMYGETLPPFIVTSSKLGEIRIEFTDRAPVTINTANDITDFETIAHINNTLLKEFAEFTPEDFATEKELDAWVKENMRGKYICKEIVPGVWHVCGMRYNSQMCSELSQVPTDTYIKVRKDR